MLFWYTDIKLACLPAPEYRSNFLIEYEELGGDWNFSHTEKLIVYYTSFCSVLEPNISLNSNQWKIK